MTLLLLFAVSTLASAAVDGERIFRTITAADGIADNSAQTMKCTKTGRMTITTIGNINFYDGANFSHINTKNETIYHLDGYKGHYHLYYDNHHHLWLKNKHGVACVNLTREHYVSNIDSVLTTYGGHGRVSDLFIDMNGDLWLSEDDAVSCRKYGVSLPLAAGEELQDLEVIGGQQVWLFYASGLAACYDVKTGRLLHRGSAYTSTDDELRYTDSGVLTVCGTHIYMIRNGKEGAVLLRLDTGSRQWDVIMRQDFYLSNMVAHGDKLYVASAQGYFTYDFNTGDITHYRKLKLHGGRELETDVNCIEFDLQGGMWIGTEHRGLLYGPPLYAPFQVIGIDTPQGREYAAMMANQQGIGEFKGMKAKVMLIDSRKWTWVGTSNGLYLYTAPDVEPTVFTRRNGLLNAVIHAVVEDDQHNIWASTSYGICCIRIVDDKVKQVFCFTESDNVPNEAYANAKAMKLDDGHIVVQGIDHVVVFNPADFAPLLEQEPYQMRLKMTKLLVNGIDVSAGEKIDGDVVLDRAITRAKEINLNYDQNSISITFSALNFARPLQTYYRVRIKELGPKWTEYSFFGGNGLVDRRGLLHLPLTGLKPGSYHIEVMASVVPGDFVGEPYTWVVNVNQPWWRTTGILLLVALVVAAMGAMNFIVYNRNTRLRMQRNSAEDDVIRRIKAFVDRCESYSNEPLSPTQEEIYGTDTEALMEPDADFVEVMQTVIAFVRESNGRTFSMHMLSKAAGRDLLEFYDMVIENIHKSPRVLILSKRLERVADLLKHTDEPLDVIAEECGFVSPNYMIAKFYHKYKMTPSEYRG